jgi:signal transduction histidine kinase
MKTTAVALLLFFFYLGTAQTTRELLSIEKFKKSSTATDKILYAFSTAEYYLDTDNIDASQKWLNIARDFLNPGVADSTACLVHSLQSELFYYNGLFQFGKDESLKEILIAKKNKDNLLIADGYFFLGIHQIELKQYKDAQESLWKSSKVYPKGEVPKRMRAIIQNEHIYNNLAQVKIKLNELDSAFFYNQKAYDFAVKAKSRRGIPNAEQTFGEIYLMKKKPDSAAYYFERSVVSATKSEYYDIVLLNYGFLLQSHSNNAKLREEYYQKGLQLMNLRMVNSAFQKYFFTKALGVFRTVDSQKTIYCQDQIIDIDSSAQIDGNLYLQNFTDQYVKNEKKLLSLEVLKLKKQKDIVLFQLIIAILLLFLLAFFILHIRRKSKINSTLLKQKNDISKDLHDDIGSGISSILIHSDLLQKNGDVDARQKVLLLKINDTAREVSQRINTFVWSLNTENNTLRDFREYVQFYAENLFEGTPIELRFIEQTESDKPLLIDGKTRKSLFFGLKEIFNNALKHSQASKITVKIIALDKRNLLIEVKDNGVGIQSTNYYGNGLKNLQKRVEELHGTIYFETQDGFYTKIRIPLSH